jgi:hypothetical protein
MNPNRYYGTLIVRLNVGTLVRKALIILLLGLTSVPTLVSGHSAETQELIVEVRLTRRGKVTKVEMGARLPADAERRLAANSAPHE